MPENSSELFMFYNVENLYSPQEKQFVRNFVPKSGLRNWTLDRYQNKIFKFGKVAEYIKEAYGHLPFIIGLAEVENDQVLQDLVKEPIFDGNYSIVHYDSLDERGVDTALLYDKTKLTLVDSETYSDFFDIEDGLPNTFDTTRDVLYCHFKREDVDFYTYVVHLPSRREKNINEPKRKFILEKLRKRIIQKLDINPAENIIVMGDFNENPNGINIEEFTSERNFNKILINPFEDLYNNKNYSTFHRGDGLLFDQIILSSSFFSEENKVSFIKSEVFSSERLTERSFKYRGQPFRTYAGTRYLGGYSDHFPVITEVKFK